MPGYDLRTPPPSGGGGQRPKRKFEYLKSAAPLIHFIFLPQDNFCDVGRGGGSAGAGQGPEQPPPPSPRGSLSNGLGCAECCAVRVRFPPGVPGGGGGGALMSL